MNDEQWLKIKEYIANNRRLSLLSRSSRGRDFNIEDITEEGLVVGFDGSKNKLKIERSRFASAFDMISEYKNEWVLIGASRVNTRVDTLEGRIKNNFNENMSGLSTAPWVAAILVAVFEEIVFNGKTKGQAVMMKVEIWER